MKPTVTPVTLDPLNVGLAVVGALLLAIGIYRMSPLQVSKFLFIQNGPLILMIIAAALIFWNCGDASVWGKWAAGTVTVTSKFLPLLVLLFAVMGAGGVVVRLYPEQIQQFLLQHHVLGPIVASFVTPTSNALVPIVENAWKVESLKPTCLYYLQASALMSLPLFMLRQTGFTDPQLSIRMYLTGLVVSLCMYPLMAPIYWAVEFMCRTGRMLLEVF